MWSTFINCGLWSDSCYDHSQAVVSYIDPGIKGSEMDAQAAQSMLQDGLVVLDLGYYQTIENVKAYELLGYQPSQFEWDNYFPKAGLIRYGGNIAASVGAINGPGGRGMFLNNSLSDKVWGITESGNGSTFYPFSDVLAKFGPTLNDMKFKTQMGPDPSAGYKPYVFLDGLYVIQPKHAFVMSLTNIILECPVTYNDDVSRLKYKTFHSGNGLAISDPAMLPFGSMHPYLTAGDPTVWQLDANTGASTALANVAGAKRLACGGLEASLYVLGGNSIVALNLDGTQRAAAALRGSMDAIAFDETKKHLFAIATGAGQVAEYDSSLNLVGTYPLTPFACTGKLDFDVNPAVAGELMAHCQGTSMVTMMMAGPTAGSRQINLGAAGITGVGIDGDGHLFASQNGLMVEYDAQGRTIESSAFNGLPGGTTVRVARDYASAKKGAPREMVQELPAPAGAAR